MSATSTTRTPTPPDVAELLLPGERCAWVGAPRRRRLDRDEVFKLPLAAVVIVGGWFMLNLRTPVFAGNTRVPPFAFGLVMLGGVYYGTLRPWLAWRARERTAYAVTDRRAVVVERGRYVASYFLDPKFRVDLQHGDAGCGTIRFAVMPRDDESEWSFLPRRLRTFASIPDAQHVFNLILAIRDRHRDGVSDAGSDVPYARRINPERDNDTAYVPTRAPHDGDDELPLNYVEPIRQKLRRGERTLFVARPSQGFLFRKTDWFVVPAALGWTAFALAFLSVNYASGCFAILGVGFVAMGLYFLVGRFLLDARIRRRTWYTITERRCLVVEEGEVIETRSVYWNFIQGVIREQHDDGTATVYFELTPDAFKSLPDAAGGTEALMHPPGVYFERIDDPHAVETLVAANVSG